MTFSSGACILLFVIELIGSITITSIGIFCINTTNYPVSFWSGETIPNESITDINAFNKANAKMYYIFSIPFWLSCVLIFVNASISIALIILDCTVGLIFLICWRYRLLKKFKV